MWPFKDTHIFVTCRVCGVPQHRTNFYSVKERRYGVRPECKQCRNLQAREEKYGIAPQAFRELLGAQSYQCAICFKPIDEMTACVDHDHETGKIRGLLDRKCNLALGHFDDDPSKLRYALTYLGG